MRDVELYFFYESQENEINLNHIDNEALILIAPQDKKNITKILAVKNKQYYPLKTISPSDLALVNEYWQSMLKLSFVAIREDKKICFKKTEQEASLFSTFKTIILKTLNFPYASFSIQVSNDGTEIRIPSATEVVGELHPSLDKKGKVLRGFEALTFLRNYKNILSDHCLAYEKDDATINLKELRHLMLISISPSFSKLLERINSVTTRFTDSPLTPKKEVILMDFVDYCGLYFEEKISRSELVENWAQSYKDKYQECPFAVLMQHRRTGILARFFNPKLTTSISLFNEFLNKEQAPPSLDKLIKPRSPSR